MGQPTQGDVHVNTPLTNLSVAFLQNQDHFVADSVFPNIPVSKQSDLYYLYDRGMFNRDEMKVRGPATESAGGDYTVSTDSYAAKLYAFHKDIPDEVRANADSVLRPDQEAVAFVTHKALIKREKLWVTKFFATSVWTGDDAGVASGPTGTDFLQWDNDASTPIEDIRARKTRVLGLTGMVANTLVLGQEVFDALLDHPDIIDRLKGGQTSGPAMGSRAALASLFDVDRVLIMKAIQNTATEGATNAHSFIGGKKALLVHAASSPGIMTPSGGYTFSWTGLLGSASSGQRIKRLRIDLRNADRIEIDMAFDQKLVAADLGQFMTTAVA